MFYCSAIENMQGDRKALHKAYHDKFYGFPLHDDNELFCQAGARNKPGRA